MTDDPKADDEGQTLLETAQAMQKHLRNIADVVREVDPKLAELLADAPDPDGDDTPEVDRLIWNARASLDEAMRRAEEMARGLEREVLGLN